MGNLRPRLSHILVSEMGLTIKRKKCQFAMDSCVYLGHMYTWVTCILGSHVYLGHMVGYSEVKPEMSKIESVEVFPIPQKKKRTSEHFWG